MRAIDDALPMGHHTNMTHFFRIACASTVFCCSAVTAHAQEESQPADKVGTDVKIGPGGKILRLDYPGTPESKKARMETVLDKQGSNRVRALDPLDDFGAAVISIQRELADRKDDVFRSKSRYLLLNTLTVHNSGVVFHTEFVDIAGDHLEFTDFRVFLVERGSTRKVGKDIAIDTAGEEVEFLIDLTYRGHHDVFRYVKGYTTNLKKPCVVTPDKDGHYLLTITAESNEPSELKMDCALTPLRSNEEGDQIPSEFPTNDEVPSPRLQLHIGSIRPVVKTVRNEYFSTSAGAMLRGLHAWDRWRAGLGAYVRAGDFVWNGGGLASNFSVNAESKSWGAEARVGRELVASRNLFLEGFAFGSFNQTRTSFFENSEQIGDVEVGRFVGYGIQLEGGMELGRDIYLSVLPSASLAPIFVDPQKGGLLINPMMSIEVGVLWMM